MLVGPRDSNGTRTANEQKNKTADSVGLGRLKQPHFQYLPIKYRLIGPREDPLYTLIAAGKSSQVTSMYLSFQLT